MRSRFSVIMALFLSLMLVSCNRHAMENAFIAGEDIRLQVGRADQFIYKPETCQLAFNKEKRTFSAHTDTMSDYFISTFSDIPTTLGQWISADISWTTHDNVLTRKKLTLEVVRLEGDKVWLWSRQGRIGLTVRILE